MPSNVRSRRITHFSPKITLPASSLALMLVIGASNTDPTEPPVLTLACIHIPSVTRPVQHNQADGAVTTRSAFDPKLEMYGIAATATDSPDVIIDVKDVTTAHDAAYAVVFHHPELMNLDPNSAGKIMNYIRNARGIDDLARCIYQQAKDYQRDPKSHQNWAIAMPMMDQDTKPITGPDGHPIYRYDLSTTTLQMAGAAPGPIADTLVNTKNDPNLQGICWYSQASVVCENTGGALPSGGTQYLLSPRYGLVSSSLTFDSSGGTFQIAFQNNYLRYLAVYAEFLDSNNDPLTPDSWTTKLPASFSSTYETATQKYLGLLPTSGSVLGSTSLTPTTVSSPLPSLAARVKLLCSGLGGWNWNPQLDAIGLMLTALFDYAVPVACLVADRTISASSLSTIEQETFTDALQAGIFLTQDPLATAADAQPALQTLAEYLGAISLSQGMNAFQRALDAQIGSGMTIKAAPIFGWPAQLVLLTYTPAQLAPTTVNVTSSPAIVEFDIAKPITISLTLSPDPMHGAFPVLATQYSVVATLCNQSIKQQGAMPTVAGPFAISIPGVPNGEPVRFDVSLTAASGAQVGMATTAWSPAIPQMSVSITEILTPLTTKTTYIHAQKLVYKPETGKHEWSAAPAPTATKTSLDSSPIGHNLARLVDIRLSQLTNTLGYTWQASGQNVIDCATSNNDSGLVFTLQNVAILPQTDQLLQFSDCGFTQQSYLLYDLLGPQSDGGLNFYFDPRNDGNHLRQVVLNGKTPFNLNTGQSWGHFNEQMDSLAIHRAGYVVGINNANSKLEVLKLPGAPVADNQAPVATLLCGLGDRPGLLHNPVAIDTTSDGRILILEGTFTSFGMNAAPRIQALDVYGNPVNCFTGGAASQIALHTESSSVTCLDMCVEQQGYIYVLKYIGDGKDPQDNLLDIYQPDGTFLTQVVGVTGAKLVVSLWRDIYTLNYESLSGPDGRTEPSVSWWQIQQVQ
jgi:hypothetical protein